jgi:hypothetical protein
MKLPIFTSIIFALLIIPCLGQSEKRDQQKLIYSTVYIDIEKVGKGKPIYADDSEERVWLKLVNNTKWSIYLGVFVFGDEENEGLFYDVERGKDESPNTEIPRGYNRGHSSSGDSELKSGNSITFSVPKNHLAGSLKIRIDFTYEWEYASEKKPRLYSRTRNSVYLSSSDLKSFLNKK